MGPGTKPQVVHEDKQAYANEAYAQWNDERVRCGQRIRSTAECENGRNNYQVYLDCAYPELIEVRMPIEQHSDLVPFA